MPHRWVTSAVGLGPFWRPHPPHSLGWQQAQLKACSAMLGSFGVHPPFSEPQFPHWSRGGGPGDFLRPFLPHAVEMLIQVKRPPSQLHPVSAPCPQGHRAFGPGTWGMGVAALTLSMWLPDQRKTNSRAQRGVVLGRLASCAGSQQAAKGFRTALPHREGDGRGQDGYRGRGQ